MILWLMYLIPSTFFTIISYLLNPIIILFCNEEGELPDGFLKNFQTWDDSCDGSFQVSCAPKMFRYNFNSKYEEHSRILEEYNRTQYYVTLKPGATFSTKERIQRYFCRLFWLTRNSAYGFSFYLLGETIRPNFTETIIDTEYVKFGYNGSKDLLIFDTPWTYQDSRREFSLFGYNFYRNFFLGWKFHINDKETRPTRVMIANRIGWKIRKGKPLPGLLD